VADGVHAFVGSENLSTTTLGANRELGVLVADAAALTRLKGVFARDWAGAQFT
jgi:phosphatidylserine/phosphatidylglycerophosphate/cardiolipin synthase-like enzyme